MQLKTIYQLKKTFLKVVKKHQEIYLFHHQRPDGDCLGAVFALQLLLKTNYPYKQIAVIGNNFGKFDFLPMTFFTHYHQINYQQSLAIVVDCGTVNRIYQPLPFFINPKQTKFQTTFCIDHHNSLGRFEYDYVYDNGDYPACCQILVELAMACKWKWTPLLATFLYLGIYTDTNRFLYPSVTSNTLKAAANCWEQGANMKLIHHQLNIQTTATLKTKAYILSNYQQQGEIVYFFFALDQQKKLGITNPNQASLPNLISGINDAKITMFFTEESSQVIRCEFRSDTIDLRPLAMSVGGGGHPAAAGAVITDKQQIGFLLAKGQQLINQQIKDNN